MYLAEIKGKLSSKLENSEDLLTSNVFSFFKYAQRQIYLVNLLTLIGVTCIKEELAGAEFHFWPTYDDHTEPDLVLIIGDHYILFEAKLFADFGEKDGGKKSQIEREIEGGLNEARYLQKQFHFIALTAHYHCPKEVFAPLPPDVKQHIRWINWQAIAALLLKLLEAPKGPLGDRQFAQDLYDLLDKKKLRGFLSFDRIGCQIETSPETIFFSAKTASFRGAFLGFVPALEDAACIDMVPPRILFQRTFFSRLPALNTESVEFKLGGTR